MTSEVEAMLHILIVEDDPHTRKLMDAILRGEGYQTLLAGDGEAALAVLDTQHVDLIVMDIMMPNMDGYELTRTLRESGFDLPILMATAKALPEDKYKGFSVGTDDYITKPIDKNEMLLRIKALLRRAKISAERKIQVGQTALYYDTLTVERGGVSITLPQKEFYLLYKLLAYPGKVFTRNQLMDEIWGMDTESADNTVNVHINRLRNKLEDFGDFEIVTVRGLGYKAVKHD